MGKLARFGIALGLVALAWTGVPLGVEASETSPPYYCSSLGSCSVTCDPCFSSRDCSSGEGGRIEQSCVCGYICGDS
ncbi:MAG TPA: hypothetical protein VF789_15760 [Thermoanaerobaculia bacterium]